MGTIKATQDIRIANANETLKSILNSHLSLSTPCLTQNGDGKAMNPLFPIQCFHKRRRVQAYRGLLPCGLFITSGSVPSLA